MQTEEEAKKLWCPMARCVTVITPQEAEPYIDSRVSRNRLIYPDSDKTTGQGSCLASGCMMWRRGGVMELRVSSEAGDSYVPGGYCGLAGRAA